MLRFQCPNQHPLKAARAMAGKVMRCPECGAAVEVPGADGRRPKLNGLPESRYGSPTKRPAPPPPQQSPPEPAAVEPPPVAAPPIVADVPHGEPAVERPGYRAERERRVTVCWLAAALFVVTLIGFLPARGYYWVGDAPQWAQAVWIMTALQLAYIVYLASIPDWSTTWVAMLVFAAVAAIYGFMLALAMWTDGSEALRFGLEPVRGYVVRWSAGMLLLTFLAAFTAGRISFTWHRRYRYV